MSLRDITKHRFFLQPLNFKLMKNSLLLLVDWGMGAMLIGVFAVVCIAMVLIVYSMSRNGKSATNQEEDDTNNG